MNGEEPKERNHEDTSKFLKQRLKILKSQIAEKEGELNILNSKLTNLKMEYEITSKTYNDFQDFYSEKVEEDFEYKNSKSNDIDQVIDITEI